MGARFTVSREARAGGQGVNPIPGPRRWVQVRAKSQPGLDRVRSRRVRVRAKSQLGRDLGRSRQVLVKLQSDRDRMKWQPGRDRGRLQSDQDAQMLPAAYSSQPWPWPRLRRRLLSAGIARRSILGLAEGSGVGDAVSAAGK